MNNILKNSYISKKSEDSFNECSSLFGFQEELLQSSRSKSENQVGFLLELDSPEIRYMKNFAQEEHSLFNNDNVFETPFDYTQDTQDEILIEKQENIGNENSCYDNQHKKLENEENQQNISYQQQDIDQKNNKNQIDILISLLCKLWQNKPITIQDIYKLTYINRHVFVTMIQKKYQLSDKLCSQLLQKNYNIKKKSEFRYLQNQQITKQNILPQDKLQQDNIDNQQIEEIQTIELQQKNNTKRHEEQYKFLSKRFLKYLKQTQKLKLNFLIENFQIYFETLYPEFRFQDYFKCNERKRQFILRKSNKFFFEIIFHHPVFTDYYLDFRNNFLKNYELEIKDKFNKILSNVYIELDKLYQKMLLKHQFNNNYNSQLQDNTFIQLQMNKNENYQEQYLQLQINTIQQKLQSKNLKLPWSFCEIQQALQFVNKKVQFIFINLN